MPVLPEDRELGPLLTRNGAASGMSTDHCGPKTSLPDATVTTVKVHLITAACSYEMYFDSCHCSVLVPGTDADHRFRLPLQ